MNIKDIFSKSLETVFGVTNIYLKSYTPDPRDLFEPRSGMEKFRFGHKHPGSVKRIVQKMKYTVVNSQC